MNRVCLDTSAYSHFKRNDARVVALVAGARDVFLPAIVLGELRTGFLLGQHAQRNETELQAFLSNPVVRVLEVDADAASLYAELMIQLKRAGTPLPTNDVWIAALAVREGATIITYDQHFNDMPRVGAVILEG